MICSILGAFGQGGASCLFAAPTLEMCTQCGSTISATRPIVYDAYPYLYGLYPTCAEDFYPYYIETGDSHYPTSRSSQSHWPIIPSHGRPNGNRTGKLRYGYTDGRVG